MATIKSYTDLSQSKKLAEILSIESADMYYMEASYNNYTVGVLQRMERDMLLKQAEYYKMLPCRSLSALLGVLPTINDEFEPQLHRSLDKYRCTYEGEEDSSGLWRVADNPVDACVEMIEKLHELKML